jgi:hypothetical protein
MTGEPTLQTAMEAISLGALQERSCRKGGSGNEGEGRASESGEASPENYFVRLAKACAPRGGKTPPGKLSLQPEALGAAHEATT